MHWKELERCAKCLEEQCPSLYLVDKVKKALNVVLPHPLDNRFSAGGTPFKNIYLEILLKWSSINEGLTVSVLEEKLCAVCPELKDALEDAKEIFTFDPKNTVTIPLPDSNFRIEYTRKPVLGRSGFSKIYTGYFYWNESDKKKAAIKRIPTSTIDHKSSELKVLTITANEHLVSFYGSKQHPDFTYYAMELALCNLEEWIKNSKSNESFKANVVKKLLQGVCFGVEALHANHTTIHRDIKPTNILIFQEAGGYFKAKLSDYGISRTRANNGVSTNHPKSGTRGWRPNEALVEEGKTIHITYHYDLFCLGLVMFFTITRGEHLFSGNSSSTYDELGDEVENNIKEDKANWEHQIHSDLCLQEWKGVVSGLVRRHPRNRSPISSVLNHPVFWNASKKLSFVHNLSWDLENETKSYEITIKIDNHFQKNFGFREQGWKSKLCDNVKKFIEWSEEDKSETNNPHKYNTKSCVSLLAFISDKDRHPQSIKKHPDLLSDDRFGPKLENFGPYFFRKFPQLVPVLFEMLQKNKVFPTPLHILKRIDLPKVDAYYTNLDHRDNYESGRIWSTSSKLTTVTNFSVICWVLIFLVLLVSTNALLFYKYYT